MKKLYALYFVAQVIFAMPCPNGGGPLYKGDALEEVIKQCGQPLQQKNVTKVVSTLKKLIYYKPLPYNAGIAQIIFLFRDDKIININIIEQTPFFLCRRAILQAGIVTTVQTSCGNWSYYTSYTTLCGIPITTGDSLPAVLQICGAPNQAIDLETNTVSITELVYGKEQGQTIIFENNKLVDWQ